MPASLFASWLRVLMRFNAGAHGGDLSVDATTNGSAALWALAIRIIAENC